MKKAEQKKILLQIAWAYLGRPYRWGGDDPMAGFDCSGFVIECLKSIGLLPRIGDWTAQGLWNKFNHLWVTNAKEGCLVFWENFENKVIHVELCLNNELAIGASGGASSTLTNEDAIKRNAYIKVRPFASRRRIKGILDPFKEEP